MLVKEIDFFRDVFNAYPHQVEFFRSFFGGDYRYYMEKLHRRAGKDAQAFNCIWLYAAMVPGNYVYTLPKIGQARNVVWEGKDLDGERWINKIPKHLIKSMNQSQCKIYFKNGSILHITGADALMNSHLGSNLKGICMSEFHKTHPAVWDYVRPIIKRSQGWAMFLFTAYGKGHSYRLFEMNKGEPNWHCRKLTVDDTRDNEGLPIFSAEQIEEERRSGMDECLIQQEYYCDDNAAIKGTFFEQEIAKAYAEGRIYKGVKVSDKFPVFTSWDIGSKDTNSIWWFQVIDKKFYYFYHHDKNYGSLEYYAQLMIEVGKKFGFVRYGGHFLPHDVKATEWTTGRSRLQSMTQSGWLIKPVPIMRVIERVQVARTQFKHCIIDSETCKVGLEALTMARSVWDENKRAFTADEEHDWTSHPSAAFQYGHVGWLDSYSKPELKKIQSYARDMNHAQSSEEYKYSQPIKVNR